MKTLPLFVVAIAALVVGSAVLWAQESGDKAPKYTIEEVMEQAHQDGLLQKVADGEATADEKLRLLDLYLSMLEQDPPQGDVDAYRAKAAQAVAAAARVVVGRDGAEGQIKRAVNCAACHRDHKPAD
ncbi:MAG TPA: hypothetical protein PJ982_15395 [Lacipirellulaceae bacterium]|nr:hypothetical protein [Lacipirellulaceae bacterium]